MTVSDPKSSNKNSIAFEWTPVQIKLLEAQDFEQQPPGTILQDFEVLLNLIGESGMAITPAHQFTLKSVKTINQKLTHPLELGLDRPMLKSFPHIQGLFLLLRASGISLIDTGAKKPLLKLDPIVLESWRSLNSTERYFELLKAWWGRASEETLGERRGWFGNILLKNFDFLRFLPKSGSLNVEKPKDADRLRYYPGYYNLGLLELFGLFDIRPMPITAGKGWVPERLQLTDWGSLVLRSYASAIDHVLERDPDLPMLMISEFDESLAIFDHWSQSLRPYLPEWQGDLEIPGTEFQPGPYVFNVMLGADCWRRIAISGDAYLDEFALAIVSAFGFDLDHLYCFSFIDRFGRTVEVDHAYQADESDNALADAVKVGDIPLALGMRIDFLFDFGDQWEFEMITESVNADIKVKKSRVLEKHGKAPKQYRDW